MMFTLIGGARDGHGEVQLLTDYEMTETPSAWDTVAGREIVMS